MRRIVTFLARIVIVVVGVIAIGLLGRSAANAAQALFHTYDQQRAYDQQRTSFPGTATQIGVVNATVSYDRTHQPTNTVTPTEPDDMQSQDPSTQGNSGNGEITPIPDGAITATATPSGAAQFGQYGLIRPPRRDAGR